MVFRLVWVIVVELTAVNAMFCKSNAEASGLKKVVLVL